MLNHRVISANTEQILREVRGEQVPGARLKALENRCVEVAWITKTLEDC